MKPIVVRAAGADEIARAWGDLRRVDRLRKGSEVLLDVSALTAGSAAFEAFFVALDRHAAAREVTVKAIDPNSVLDPIRARYDFAAYAGEAVATDASHRRLSLAAAVGSRRVFYALGIGCLVVSDVFIVCGWLRAPFWHNLTGPVYVLALVCMAVSLFARDREPRFRDGGGKNPLPVVLVLGALCAGLFLAAMVVCPGGNYNPLMRMLSYLGRTVIKDVYYPLSHYLFTLGMVCGAAATLYFAPYFRAEATTPRRRSVVGWGAAVCAGGLLLIACVPENVSMPGHNAGCWLAFLGGLAMLLALANTPPGRRAFFCLLPGAGLFGLATLLHALKVIPFSPAVPSMQKVVIVSFMAWQLTAAFRAAATAR